MRRCSYDMAAMLAEHSHRLLHDEVRNNGQFVADA
jgi:hypothetical protein